MCELSHLYLNQSTTIMYKCIIASCAMGLCGQLEEFNAPQADLVTCSCIILYLERYMYILPNCAVDTLWLGQCIMYCSFTSLLHTSHLVLFYQATSTKMVYRSHCANSLPYTSLHTTTWAVCYTAIMHHIPHTVA